MKIVLLIAFAALAFSFAPEDQLGAMSAGYAHQAGIKHMTAKKPAVRPGKPRPKKRREPLELLRMLTEH